MSSGIQVGQIGTGLKVNQLPTASATTKGNGNRFYTLVGTQTGYETGATYQTLQDGSTYYWAKAGEIYTVAELPTPTTALVGQVFMVGTELYICKE